MKQILTTLVLMALCFSASAQQKIALDNSGQSTVTAENGNLEVNVAGMSFSLAGGENTTTKSNSKVKFDFAGVNASTTNHLSLFEIGSNFVVNTDFSAYDAAMQHVLGFTNRKSVNVNLNLLTMNVALNPKKTLGFTLGFGFAMENYCFGDKVSLKYEQGSFQIVELDTSIRKSKLSIDYIHIPLLFDWNIRNSFFISVGANLDILMASRLAYKKPKTKLEERLPLNPVQVGVTARVGWRRIYAYVNYSLLNMYKSSSQISANRMSAGVGFYF